MKTVVVVLVSLMVALPAAFCQVYLDPPAGETVSQVIDAVHQKEISQPMDWTFLGSVLIDVAVPTGLAFDGQFLRVPNWGGNIYSIDPSTGFTTNIMPSPSQWPGGITYDGTNLWVTDYLGQSQIFKVDPISGATIASYPIPYSYYWAGAAWDGQYIYFGVNGYTTPEVDYIYKMDPNTGALLGNFTIPSSYISGLTYYDGHLWYSDKAELMIYKITTSGVVVESSPVEGSYPSGVTFANGYLYCVDRTTARIYQYDITPPEVSVTLTPVNPPIIIPANGGIAGFNIEVSNIGTTPGTFDVWTLATLPSGGQAGPLILAQGITLGAGVSADRDREQFIPSIAPAGTYSYDAYAGSYPSTILAEDHFDFTKSATDEGSGFIYGWACSGEGFGGEALSTAAVPAAHRLLTAYPNPFNNQAAINFELADAGFVELTVYDVTGREVASLVSGHLSAGLHDVTWNAEGMTSGVYFVRLAVAGRQTAGVQKVILIK